MNPNNFADLLNFHKWDKVLTLPVKYLNLGHTFMVPSRCTFKERLGVSLLPPIDYGRLAELTQ